MKKGFVFDLDGVLTDTASYHYIAWKNLAESIGITIDLTFNEQLKGISRMDSLDRILVFGGKGELYTRAEKEQLAEKKNEEYVGLLQSLGPKDLLPGVAEFLEETKQAGVPCALASASKNAPFILDRLGVADHFIGIVDPDSLHRGKPDPEIFLKAAEMLNLQPEACIGFEDAQAGIAALKGAGMYAVGVVTSEPLTGADISVSRLDELKVAELMEK